MQEIIKSITSIFTPISISKRLEEENFSDKFISLSINKNLTDKISLDRVLQLEDAKKSYVQYVLSKDSNKLLNKFFKNNRLISLSKEENSDFNQVYKHKIAQLFHFSIEQAKNILKKKSEINSDISNETKGLEWIKVTLVVLKSAVKNSITDPELIFEGQFFNGKRNLNEPYQIRIQCLSLDFLLEFLDDGRLRVLVWNYKNLKPNSKAEPSFSGEFVELKQHVFDEIIQLLVEMSKASTQIN